MEKLFLLERAPLAPSSNFKTPAYFSAAICPMFANYDHPRIEFANIGQIAALKYAGVLKLEDGASGARSSKNNFSIVAFYDMPQRTIYLAEGWTGKTPAESSVLVHEMVHHLQTVSGQK